MSDPVARAPGLAERMDDIRAVMDAAGSQAAALFGVSDGGCLCIAFAVAHPERSAALVTYGSFARRLTIVFLRCLGAATGVIPSRVVAAHNWGSLCVASHLGGCTQPGRK